MSASARPPARDDEPTPSRAATGPRTRDRTGNRTGNQTGRQSAAPTGAQEVLPFDASDGAADEPIAFSLTARARRTIAPEALPSLRVIGAPVTRAPAVDAPAPAVDDRPAIADPVTDPVSDPVTDGLPHPVVEPIDVPVDDDPGDTRPARARALRRAGTEVSTIAGQLGVDDLLVRAWVDGVTGPVVRRGSGARGTSTRGTVPRRPPATGLAAPLHPGGGDAVAESARTALELARADARAEARRRLAGDHQLATGLGLLAGIVEVDRTTVTIATDDPRVAGAVRRWLTTTIGVEPELVRVLLRLGPRAAGDLARHRWARSLEVPVDRVRTTRWSAAPAPEAVDGLLRIVDADVAAVVAGWRDALLDGDLDDDPAF